MVEEKWRWVTVVIIDKIVGGKRNRVVEEDEKAECKEEVLHNEEMGGSGFCEDREGEGKNWGRGNVRLVT